MRWVLLLLATVLAGTAAWFLFSEERGAGEPGEEAAHDTLGGRTGPALEGARHATASTAPVAQVGRCTLLGVVTRGGVAARATVEARLAPAREWSDRADTARAYYEGRLRTPEVAAAGASASTTTDGEGRFHLEGLVQGSYDLVARDGDGARAHRIVVLPAEGVRVAVTLALQEPGLVLQGRAHFTDGRPVPGRVVAWAPLAGDIDPWEVTPGAGASEVEIGPDGSFTLVGLVRGRHVVRVFLADGGVAMAPLAEVPSADAYEVFVPHLPVTMRGRVQSEPGADPVAGAMVLCYASSGLGACPVHHRAVTDADGRFRLPGPEASASLTVLAPGLSTRWFDVPHPSEEFVLRLPLPARVEGRVLVLGSGRPAAGARVQAHDEEGNDGWEETVADAEGHYLFAALTPGVRSLTVLGGGWASPGLGTESQDRRDRVFTLEVTAKGHLVHDLTAEPSVRLEGTVRAADGQPLAGASVELVELLVNEDEDWSLRSMLPQARLASAADGSFAFPDLPAGAAARLAAWAPGEAPVRIETFPLVPPGPVRADLRLGHGAWLDVRVVGEEDGTAIPGARVSVDLDGLDDEAEAGVLALTGTDGHARLGPLGEGEVEVQAWAAGVRASRSLEVGPNAARDVELRLRRGFTLRGTVLRADGAPAPGARVQASAVEIGSQNSVNVVTGRDGAFRVESLAAGRWILAASLEDADSEPVAVDAGAEGIVFRLREAPTKAARRTVRLNVLDPGGRSLPSFRVSVREPDGGRHDTDGWEGRADLSTGRGDGDDAFGDVVVHGARGGDGQPLDLGPARVVMPASGEGPVEVRLAPGLKIEGRVLRPDGTPARGLQVTAGLVPASDEAGVPPFEIVEVEARADTDGRFRLVGLAEGVYRIRLEAPPGCAGPATDPEVRAGAGGVEIRLRQALTTRLRILTWDGRPLPGAQVWMQRDDWWDSQEADGEGRVVFQDLNPAAAWRLTVEPPDGDEDALPLEFPSWRPADGDVRLERARHVAGHVRDPSGGPLENAQVSRVGADGDDTESILTDAAGAFRLGRVPPGTVRLRVRPAQVSGAGIAAELVTSTVEAGREDVVLTVDPGHVVRVRLTDRPKGDRPLNGAVLWSAQGEVQRDDVRESSALGVFRLGGLEPEERYMFWLPVSRTHYALAEFDGRTSEVVAPVREGRSIRGRIVGFPLGDQVWVSAVGPGGVSVQVNTDREGRFEFQGLPPGRWRANVSVGDGEDERKASAEAEAGGVLELVLPPAPRR